MKDKITAFERRIEMLFFLTKQRKSSIVELAKNYSVCRKTAYNDIMFLSRYAPIYTKGGVNGGVFLMDDYHAYYRRQENYRRKGQSKNKIKFKSFAT